MDLKESDCLIEVHWTSQNLEEAQQIVKQLVQRSLVACGQIYPEIHSLYLWNDNLEMSQESKVVLKTRLEHYPEIRQLIEKNCSYDVPEILWMKIEGGNPSYLNWLMTQTTKQDLANL